MVGEGQRNVLLEKSLEQKAQLWPTSGPKELPSSLVEAQSLPFPGLQADPPRSSELDGVNWVALTGVPTSSQALVAPWKSRSCSLEGSATALTSPGGSSLAESLIRGVLPPMGVLWHHGGARVRSGVDGAGHGPIWSPTDKRSSLWKALKGDLEIEDPRVRGERAQKGLADSRSEVGENPRGTPNIRARDRSVSGKTIRSAVRGLRTMGGRMQGKRHGEWNGEGKTRKEWTQGGGGGGRQRAVFAKSK